MRVSLHFKTLNSPSGMSWMECSHPRFFFLTWSQEFQEVIDIAQEIENSMQLVIGLPFHSSAIKDVDHDELFELRGSAEGVVASMLRASCVMHMSFMSCPSLGGLSRMALYTSSQGSSASVAPAYGMV